MVQQEKPMAVRMDPAEITLQRADDKVVHDVGEITHIPTACGKARVTVFTEDGITGEPINAEVHLPTKTVPANHPFEHLFKAEWDTKLQAWIPEGLWVEAPGYNNLDVDFRVKVDEEDL